MLSKNFNLPNYSFIELGIDEQMALISKFGDHSFYDFEELHSHQFVDILVFRKGGGTHVIDFNDYQIKDCSVHVVSTNSLHQAKRNHNSDGFSILITPFFLEQLQNFDTAQSYLEYFSQSKIIEYDEAQFADFDFLFNNFCAVNGNRSYTLNLLAAFLSKLISNGLVETYLNKMDPIVIRFISHLKDHLRSPNCIRDFISKENISEVVIRRKINKCTGKTPNKLLMEKVIIESKRLLYSTEYSVKEIAFELNFESESYFCRQFKKYEQLTPVEFRQLSKKSHK